MKTAENLIIEKQDELIKHLASKGNWNYANPDWDEWQTKYSTIIKELAALKKDIDKARKETINDGGQIDIKD
jgi:hypothetical protein